MTRAFAKLVCSYTRAELPGWGRLLGMTGASRPEAAGRWYPSSEVTIRGKRHGYLMRLDLSNPWDRRTYFLGRFAELETEMLMASLLREGDTVIDVGANRGMFMLSCARLVGATGRVIAFEPNPTEADRVDQLIRLNALGQVSLERVALGDVESEMELSVVDGVSALATLASVEGGRVSRRIRVPVRPGDALLGGVITERTVIKIDVEGFECRVLRGLERSISSASPALYVEVEPEWLQRADSSDKELVDLLHGWGYRLYKPWTRRRLLRQGLKLTPIASASDAERVRRLFAPTCRNVLALRPGSPYTECPALSAGGKGLSG